ncbi:MULTISPECIES: CoA-transferase [unclassified Mesobacillus]|uniref:acyl CoA:acetate/3-ketoacid CoA transferase n=1 Tax=unclassified Mesobacillus TaxID=2675270 RepID=UPI00203D4608|nr:MULTISPECIES: CoA-transferase [unclassified Mesobacillus]MCM3125092.1 acyl CoA:acetate/3-ketoacid CoA transferase [Mesobacillus sp. MER 33]MCM3235148.1 acyl CoA:acetate/3-ketoacid CoA transferase [Mesobacillus sp. MER 48]
MSSVKIISSQKAANLITDNAIVGLGGFIGVGVAEEIYIEVEKRFLESQSPRNLTLMYAAGNGDGVDRGMNHYAHEGLVKRIIGGHMGLAPKFQPLVVNDKIEAYNLPQGVISQMFRDGAAGKPRTVTHVGLGTFVDPDIDGGKLNQATKEEIVEKVNFDGKSYLAYRTQKLDFALLKGSVSDENGNISFEKEPLTLEILSIAMNARNSGGKVIVQVEKIVKNGSIDPKLVAIPGILVDYVVVVENPANHMQTFGTQHNEDFYRSDVVHKQSDKKYPLNERKVIARRAAMLLNEDIKVLNYGIGVPEIIAHVLQEEGMNDQFTPTLEPGAIGGTAAGGLDFGCSIGPQAIIDQPYMFDYYDGGGIDAAFLGLAQCDTKGNINVSKFGPKIAGCGGFINITQNARQIAFCGTFTAGGLKVGTGKGKLEILQEGKAKKFIENVEQITFSGDVARENNKRIIYITERAVFELLPEGLTLTEIAPGINLERDILSQMNFRPLIAKDLKLMDSRIFMDEPMGLKDKKTPGLRNIAAI